MNYLPTCTSRLVGQHPCQVSFKSMQGCRSWEDKLKCVKILSVKDHNSAKICPTWIISPHALLDLWCNIPAKFHWNPCKDVGGVEKTNFDVTEGRNDGRTEWRTKQTLNAPLPFYGGGIKSKNNLWIPSPNNQISTLDPTSDKSQGGVQTMPLVPMLEKEARAQLYRDKHMWRNASRDRVLFNHFNNSGVT